MAICPACGGFTPEGCTCSFGSTDSVRIDPSTTSSDEVQAVVPLDPSSDNFVQNDNGLLVPDDSRYSIRPRASFTADWEGPVFYNDFPNEFGWLDTIHDPLGMLHPTDNRLIVIPVTGLWHVGAQASTLFGPTGQTYMQILLDRVQVIGEAGSRLNTNGKDTSVQVYAEEFLEEGDIVTITIQGVNTNVQPQCVGNAQWSPIVWLSWRRDHKDAA